MGATDGCEKGIRDWESWISLNVQEDEGSKGREIVPLHSQAVPQRLYWSGYGPASNHS